MAISLKKQIEKAISKKEQESESVRSELTSLQLSVLDRIKRDCEGVCPYWVSAKVLGCSLVMQGVSRKWSEHTFQFYFQDSATLEGSRISDQGKRGEFCGVLGAQVQRCIKGFLAEQTDPQACS